MGNHEKAVLSKKNRYYISKHRYYELKHFCLQYDEWIEEIRSIEAQKGRGDGIGHSDPQYTDPTANGAIRLLQLKKNIELIKDSAKEAGGVLFDYIFISVTQERSYVYLKEMMNIPCGKDMFYESYRKFFWVLSRRKL